MANAVEALYKSLLPDTHATEFQPICNVFKVIAEKIRSELPEVDISAVMAEVEALLNRSIATEGYVMPPSHYIDLSQIDFEALRKQFEKGRKSIEVQKLRERIALKLAQIPTWKPSSPNSKPSPGNSTKKTNAASPNNSPRKN
jgi:type I restriction enzyme R subunit